MAPKLSVVRLEEKFAKFQDLWSPKIVAQMNDYHVKIVKVKGDFVNHTHPEDDEFFLVMRGRLRIRMPDRTVELGPGEVFVVPKGVEHHPSAAEETHMLLLERAQVVNTGEERTSQTVERPQWI